jgi:hypothetical protein
MRRSGVRFPKAAPTSKLLSGNLFGSEEVLLTGSLGPPAPGSDVAETADIWDIAMRSHVITVTVPGLSDGGLLDLGPGASELITTVANNPSTDTFPKMDIGSIPG